ncbi:LytR/AlgR family response regulator transcription factor [Chitinophaga barathri]|uniref:DNA-binding response regulator n=1 Tax=Chitinophaga barathri TaxID=1647451 RepID=A0A3N4MGR0_9BACT|nr:LytTR family DNA-binding domain-containing protein [Chitinophaga barathri]RPD43051.1 DNA-binding response regulator [Chitinophaga barathri]
MKLSCVILDDDDLALRLLSDYISRLPQLELRGVFTDARIAKTAIEQSGVDLVILDIQMPDLTGIELLGSLESKPHAIITTSYQDYAYEGFRLQVVDYLLKPFLFERFEMAVNKVLAYHQFLPAQGNRQGYIFVKANGIIEKIPVADILFLEGSKQYVKIFLKERYIITLDSMKNFDAILSAQGFLRVHKSYIVYIHAVDAVDGSCLRIGDYIIPVGKTYRQEIVKKIGFGS